MDSLRPGSISLRDIPPQSSRKSLFGLTPKSFDAGEKGDAAQLQAIMSGIVSGQYQDQEIQEFAKLYPETAPLLSQAIRQREVFKSNFQQPKAPVYEGPETMVSPGQPGKADLGGAIVQSLGAGDLATAEALHKYVPKEGAEKNITSIQLGLRAEGQKTGDPRIDSLDPKTAANVLARTTPPIAVQTVGGTALYGRGGVPGGSTPSFLPEAYTAEEAKNAARGEVAGTNLNKLESLLKKKGFSPGPVSGRALRLSGITGVKLSDDEAEALSLEQGLSNDLLQAMRGAQVGPKEQEMFNKQLPRVDQPEALFRANLRRTKDTLKQLNAITNEKRRGGAAKGRSRAEQLDELLGAK